MSAEMEQGTTAPSEKARTCVSTSVRAKIWKKQNQQQTKIKHNIPCYWNMVRQYVNYTHGSSFDEDKRAI